MGSERPRARVWRAPSCPWCDAPMREHDRDVWLCSRDSCAGAAFGRNAVRPLCPVHYRRMERLGNSWLCPDGCQFEIPWELLRRQEPGTRDDPRDNDPGAQFAQEVAEKLRAAKPGRSGRRRRRFGADRRLEEWRRRRRAGTDFL